MLKITVLLCFLSLLSHPAFAGTSASNPPGMEAMYTFANSQLPRILEFMPVDREHNYGFNHREEFKRARLGIPYQEYSLDSELPTGYWRIPVTVDGENRALLRLIKENGKWTFAGFGGATLAGELGYFERSFGVTKPVSGRIVRDFKMQCDYVQFNQKTGAKLEGLLYPMESASRVLHRLSGGTAARSYTLEKIKELRSGIRRLPRKDNLESK
jgi:hypothetical protein